jgi:hypothetical protein
MRQMLDEAPPGRTSRRAVAAAAALMVVAGVGLGAWLLLQRGARTPTSSARASKAGPSSGSTSRPAPADASANATGVLEIVSNLDGATVTVDGQRLGSAPQRALVKGGSHRVLVEKQGFEPLERDVHVIPGRTARLDARLEGEPGRLRVDADVTGASVFLDRKFLGKTPVETRDFAPGTHRLNVTAEGYEMYAETIELSSGSREVMVRFKEVHLDQAVAVVHKHGLGSCRGRLVATPAGLRYETANAGDAFDVPLATLEPLEIDYLSKNLKVKRRGGKTWNFTAPDADALLTFQKAVEGVRKRM